MKFDWPMRVQFCKCDIIMTYKLVNQAFKNLSNLSCSDETKRLDECFYNWLYQVTDWYIYTKFHDA